MARKTVLREAEIVAGEPLVDVFAVTQLRDRVIFGGILVVLSLGFAMFDFENFIDQWLVFAAAFGVASLFMRSRFITITPTRALLMESGRVCPCRHGSFEPSQAVR